LIGATCLVQRLEAIVGKRNLLTNPGDTAPYCAGYRHGSGPALAVAKPTSLIALWRTLQACVESKAGIIVQAANTGLTGGSTPYGDDYDRPIVIISPMAIDGIHLLDGGRQVICLPGATLHRLEALLRPLGREPHSLIGSSCIGASVMGGICNNSGGALVRRGPAYTEFALYARLDQTGELHLVNHLGLRLGSDPEAILRRLEQGCFEAADLVPSDAQASDRDYPRRVREIDAPTPARYNADPARLFGASGCAGKIALFAVRLDTFPAERTTTTFYIGTNDPADLTSLRRRFLREVAHLPISAEYMHRDCFDMADRYGKDMFVAIRLLGTSRLRHLAALKAMIDRGSRRIGMGSAISDRILQGLAWLCPDHLPRRMRAFRDKYEHHLILKVSDEAADEATIQLHRQFPSTSGDMFECAGEDADKAFLHRFVAASAAVRFRALFPKEVEDIVALDVALPRNATVWLETLPPELDAKISHKLYYGHFFCHVLHQDYVVRRGVDPLRLERDLCRIQDARGAEYPAEHNVGHLYAAKAPLAAHYRALDPCNAFNPGIGMLSKRANWSDAPSLASPRKCERQDSPAFQDHCPRGDQ
jgi:D-lactate dehydrogenase (quinone)